MAQISNWDKFVLLLWKNWILQWSRKRQLFFELLFPIIYPLLLIMVHSHVEIKQMPAVHYPPLSIDNLDLFRYSDSTILLKSTEIPQYSLYYSPKNDVLDSVVGEAAKSLGLNHTGFKDAKTLQTSVLESNAFAGIEFDESWSDLKELPDNFKYTMRFPSELRTSIFGFGSTWETNKIFWDTGESGPRNLEYNDGGVPAGYLREGFIPIQHALSMSYIRKKSGQEELPEVVMQRYPHPPYDYDALLQYLDKILSSIMLLSFLSPFVTITRYVTAEKEKQQKEVMKIMGLNNWLHWAAWFVTSFTQLMISAIIMVALLKIPWKNGVAILSKCSFTALLFFIMIYIVATICFCFMIAPIFTKASTASAVTGVILCIAYLPLTSIDPNTLSLASKLGWSLISNTALKLGVTLIVQFENTDDGFQWNKIFPPASINDLTVGDVMIMMVISSAIYLCIGLYIEQVFPGDFGVPRKWYFPFTRSFWFGERINENIPYNNDQVNRRSSAAFEAEPDDKKIGLLIRNMKKKFGKKLVVNGLSINMFEDEITVLLGHNGAGKTTTISMLTGMFPPTSGTAIINGCDIRTNIEGARMSLSICPQHNVLFDDMSVGNHLRFFSRMKGLKGDAVEAQVQKYLKLIELENKETSKAGTLSGGMKRKLSVCCALCGDSKVVLCDEPSSGMDPAARRQLWDLLRKEKMGRTILLTTHFMDEADVLGDRITIMCDGELKCYGSSFFLKKHFGSGYSLICVKEENCNPAEVTALLALYIPGIQPKSDIGAELSYALPDKYSDRFEKMLGALEDRSAELHLSGYGIGITSMEEVFMKVGAEINAESDAMENRKKAGADWKGTSRYSDDGNESMRSDRAFTDQNHLLRGMQLTLNQCHAMMMKKMLYTWRNKLLFFIQNLVPKLFVVITLLSSSALSSFRELPPMKICREQYPQTVTVMERYQNLTHNSTGTNVANHYEELAKSIGSSHLYASTGNKNFTKYILDLGASIQSHINTHYVVAASMGDDRIIAWLNNEPLHTAPLTVNMVHNAIARLYVGEDATIEVTNHPYPYSKKTELSEQILRQIMSTIMGIVMATNLGICMCFVSTMYILFLIKERQSRAKLLQFVSGVRVWTFWLINYIWDFFTLTITCVIIIITIFCFQVEGFMKFDELGRYFLLLIVFAFAVLPFTYLLSLLFEDPATGFSRVTTINMIFGVVVFWVVWIMSMLGDEEEKTSTLLSSIFRIFPHFSLVMGLNKAYSFVLTQSVCENYGSVSSKLICEMDSKCCNVDSIFRWDDPGIMKELVYMMCTGIVCFLVLVIGDMGLINELILIVRKRTIKAPPPPEVVDEDVERERQRILNMKPHEMAAKNLVLDRVSKCYGSFTAVNQVSLCVKEVECFGLLGVNGAGKTTTFKMLTGDEKISWGSAYVQGLNLQTHMGQVYRRIGYCPQFDALLDNVTGREMLRIFCLLRGVPKENIKPISEDLAKSFGFMKHIDKFTVTYSGGNKRKLSAAIAMIGSPSVIYLDEPTTGMDPAARRQLWNMVCSIRDSGKSIVLTSHSMEECEALCTRLAIMVNGEFKCIGSTQHLKNRFSKGLILKIKVRRSKSGLRSSQLGNGSRYRTQVSEVSIPSTPVQCQNSSDVPLLRSVKIIKIPHSSNDSLQRISDDQMDTAGSDRDNIDEVTAELRRNPDAIPGFSGQKMEDSIDNVKKFVDQHFPQAILQEEYYGMLTYYIPLDAIKWSKIFGLMEESRYKLNVEDYSISQTTLEEIFLHFARHQCEDPRTSQIKKLKKQQEIQNRREMRNQRHKKKAQSAETATTT
ncbi:ATP-binding cassette sub-family A member 3-like isoform X3 [Drosophila innubila]|uniref:ATP-binding cassette sub-family A member 3-like isoform X3 n=1 Tax=Drosophila innubila TaxID=198719 RepID=UPI00148D274C|nr:ATP-binding cassette sub-family A member 3-like isoform X3 [Drosophila innubila]